MTKYLSVVIPAYNEVKNLRRGVLSSVYDFLKTKDFSWEVLVVDDGSKDHTKDKIALLAKRYKNIMCITHNTHNILISFS